MPNSVGTKPGSKADPKSSPKADSHASGQPGDRKATGRVVHDERGNAVWDWIVETGRIFMGNTSRLLKKLEAPELKIDDTPPELRLESERDAGGGYDPYSKGVPRKPGRKP